MSHRATAPPPRNFCLARFRETRAPGHRAERKRINSQSSRAFAQWGTLRALTATSPVDLAAGRRAAPQVLVYGRRFSAMADIGTLTQVKAVEGAPGNFT